MDKLPIEIINLIINEFTELNQFNLLLTCKKFNELSTCKRFKNFLLSYDEIKMKMPMYKNQAMQFTTKKEFCLNELINCYNEKTLRIEQITLKNWIIPSFSKAEELYFEDNESINSLKILSKNIKTLYCSDTNINSLYAPYIEEIECDANFKKRLKKIKNKKIYCPSLKIISLLEDD